MVKMVNFMYIVLQLKKKMLVQWLTERESMPPLFSNLDHFYIWYHIDPVFPRKT